VQRLLRRVGLITTADFGDILEIGTQQRRSSTTFTNRSPHR